MQIRLHSLQFMGETEGVGYKVLFESIYDIGQIEATLTIYASHYVC